MGRCGGDGRCPQAHEVEKLATKRLVLCDPDPGGFAIPSSQILIEPRHMRSDDNRPGDLFSRGPPCKGCNHRRHDLLFFITTLLTKISTKSDYALGKAKNTKFTKDLRSVNPIQLSATKRVIPLVMNPCGRRGPRFEAMIREFASLLIKRSSGCNLFQGPFALPPTFALAKVLSCWAARLTWTA